MASSNRRSSQKQPGEAKRAESVPLTFSPELNRHQEDWEEDDDQISAVPTRSPNSSIRYQPPQQSSTGQRRSETRDMRTDRDTSRQQAPNVQAPQSPATPRRTGQVPGANPAPIPTRAGRTSATGAVPGQGQGALLPSPANQPSRRSLHWMVYVGVGMIAALALWVSLSAILGWGTTEYNNIVYGYPRFYQTDAVVGHGDSPEHPRHYIAQNLHGQVIVIELPAGNPAKSYAYVGPDLIANGDDQIPITLSFSDVNHNGKPEMIIHIENREVIFCNDGTKFAQCSS
jgi:hypothetical protein